MEKVIVKKDELTAKLAVNMNEHVAVHNEAMEGYRKELIEEVKDFLEAAMRKEDPRVCTRLTAPESHADDYDRIIAMVEMHQDDLIELTEMEFRQYVMDDWHWKPDFMRTQVMYAKKRII